MSVPIVNKGEFKDYHIVPVPIPVNDDKLIYIRTDKSILCVDKTRQYYYFSSDLEIKKCKNPLSKDVCVNRAIPYCLVSYRKSALCDF